MYKARLMVYYSHVIHLKFPADPIKNIYERFDDLLSAIPRKIHNFSSDASTGFVRLQDMDGECHTIYKRKHEKPGDRNLEFVEFTDEEIEEIKSLEV